MVVFTCNHCGESVQKPKVEKHYQFSCRNPVFLTCVDCLKDFRGDEFNAHIKCVSEDQRYGAKNNTYEVAKKGELKQESWVEMIRSIIKEEQNLQLPHRNLLNKIANFNNVPRKKQKFLNFIKNSCGGRVNMNDVEAIWDIIERYKTKNSTLGTKDTKSETNVTNEKDSKAVSNCKINIISDVTLKNGDCKPTSVANNETNGNLSNESKKRKKKSKKALSDSNDITDIKSEEDIGDTKKNNSHIVPVAKAEIVHKNGCKNGKRKHNLDTEINESEPTEKKSCLIDINGQHSIKTKFDFKSRIIDVLQSKNTMSPKKLQKKVKKMYVEETGKPFSDKVLQKYLKKLNQIENIECTEEYVRLC